MRLERAKRLDKELAALFGRSTVEQAKATDPACLELTEELMDLVHDSADKLLESAGNTIGQRRIVMALPQDVRLVLCMWIHDMDLAAKLTAQLLRKAA